MPWFQSVRRSATGAALGALALAASTSGSAADPLSGLSGSWSGAGQFRLEDGRSESLRCNANYSPKRDALGLSLRCASASGRIELRAHLVARGNRVSGTLGGAQLQCCGQRVRRWSRQQLAPGHQWWRLVRFDGRDDDGRVPVHLGAHGRRGPARHQHQLAPQLTAQVEERIGSAALRRSCSSARGRR